MTQAYHFALGQGHQKWYQSQPKTVLDGGLWKEGEVQENEFVDRIYLRRVRWKNPRKTKKGILWTKCPKRWVECNIERNSLTSDNYRGKIMYISEDICIDLQVG